MKVTKYNKYAVLLILTIIFCLSAEAQSSLTAKDIEAIRGVEETYRAAWLKNSCSVPLSGLAATWVAWASPARSCRRESMRATVSCSFASKVLVAARSRRSTRAQGRHACAG